jgi:1,4-dihydroxy-2-naphthoate octaprenyltransferase
MLPYLETFITIPLAVRSVNVARKYYDEIPKLVKANADTIKIYQIVGLIMILSSLVSRF